MALRALKSMPTTYLQMTTWALAGMRLLSKWILKALTPTEAAATIVTKTAVVPAVAATIATKKAAVKEVEATTVMRKVEAKKVEAKNLEVK
jgi:hypothetical protein